MRYASPNKYRTYATGTARSLLASLVFNQEIQSLKDVLNVGIDAYTTDKADQLLSTIRNAPKVVVSKFVFKAIEEEGDVESFRADVFVHRHIRYLYYVA